METYVLIPIILLLGLLLPAINLENFTDPIAAKEEIHKNKLQEDDEQKKVETNCLSLKIMCWKAE
ncbi:hypothetical protein AM500_17000 [Bacillus sp. FJAT-18017]|uniref:hypothetical protein n=1 Tax=Bacillus sp. FJAT-18017 TaxID=1705566 RepID=UPI0006AE6CA8|nr:hypothetical protein [Bacillus sp. FJAT-18017]ALC91304.1 hypothetical protein AM500_17000 [Bacillus sp. FJAT-18017]